MITLTLRVFSGHDTMRFTWVFLLFWILSVAAFAAEISVERNSSSPLSRIQLTGEISHGDEKRFLALALPLDEAEVILDSPGGSILAAIEIGKIVRLDQIIQSENFLRLLRKTTRYLKA